MTIAISERKSTTLIEICKRIFSLAVPMASTQLINVASGFLCMAMLAHLGGQVLAASALIYSTQLSIMVTGMSVLFSLSVLVGHAYGGNKYLSIGNYVQQSWTLGLLISIPMMIFFWEIKPILIFFGQAPPIAEIVQTFFHAFVWAVIPGLLSTCNQQFGYGIHKKILIISTSLMSVIVLLITSYVLIFGKYGFPHLGVAGLGYGLAAQYAFFFIFTTVFFYVEKSFDKYELFRYRVHQHMDHFKEMFKIGWPISVQMGGEVLSLFVTGIMVGWLGTKALAAYQIINQYYFLALIPLFSLSQASGILVGQANGAKKFHEIKQLGYASLVLTVAVTLGVMALFAFIPQYLASVYIDIHDPQNTEVLKLTTIIFLIAGFSLIFDGIRNIFIGATRGLFDTKFPMYMGLIAIWIIGMPLAYLLAFTFHVGIAGIMLGGLVSMIVGALIMLYRWHTLSSKY